MTYLPQEIIRAKRDGRELSAAEIQAFVTGLVDDSFTDGQVAALAMAVFFRGMSMDERIALTLAMRDSGDVLDWTGAKLPGPVVDKHSTGGVGDKVSLVLAPILAACGAAVPMISGRGLGHTGGTLDKLESIPGYTAKPDNALFRRVVEEVGCAIIGQTGDLAPADKRFYAIRDITATVESIPLITASILSKKLAAGLQHLVMDVKWGTGAFANNLPMAQELARSIATVAEGAGLRCVALVTDMNQVLGRTAGNAIEVHESIAMLRGEQTEPRLHEVTIALCGELLVMAGLASDLADARRRCETALSSGAAAERFAKMVAALGGPSDLLDAPERHLAAAKIVRPAAAAKAGVVTRIDARKVGIAVLELGGGRKQTADTIDYAVGLGDIVGIGEAVGGDRPLAIVHANDEAAAKRAEALLGEAIEIGEGADAGPVIVERITAAG